MTSGMAKRTIMHSLDVWQRLGFDVYPVHDRIGELPKFRSSPRLDAPL